MEGNNMANPEINVVSPPEAGGGTATAVATPVNKVVEQHATFGEKPSPSFVGRIFEPLKRFLSKADPMPDFDDMQDNYGSTGKSS